MSFQVTQVIPILRIFDLAKAKEFYLGFLGFALDWEHGFEEGLPAYLQVSRGGLTVHLSEHYGDACPGAAVFVRMSGLDTFQAELNAKAYKYLRPGIEHTEWGSRMMEVIDPFGNRIRFNEPLSAGVEATIV